MIDLGLHIPADGIAGLRALPESCVDLLVTDPPYRDYQSNRSEEKAPKVEKWSPEERDLFFLYSYKALKPGRHLYCFCDQVEFNEIKRCLEYFGFKYLGVIYWIKNNHGSGDLKCAWGNKVELIIHAGSLKGGKVRGLIGKRPVNVLYGSRVQKSVYGHGTVKPQEVLEPLILKSSHLDEIVVDPFAGTNATGEACERLGRKYIGWEIDAQWKGCRG